MLCGPPVNRLLPQARNLDNGTELKSATVPLLNVRWVSIAHQQTLLCSAIHCENAVLVETIDIPEPALAQGL